MEYFWAFAGVAQLVEHASRQAIPAAKFGDAKECNSAGGFSIRLRMGMLSLCVPLVCSLSFGYVRLHALRNVHSHIRVQQNKSPRHRVEGFTKFWQLSRAAIQAITAARLRDCYEFADTEFRRENAQRLGRVILIQMAIGFFDLDGRRFAAPHVSQISGGN